MKLEMACDPWARARYVVSAVLEAASLVEGEPLTRAALTEASMRASRGPLSPFQVRACLDAMAEPEGPPEPVWAAETEPPPAK